MMAGGGPFKCAPGQVTDDGELTMSLAWVRLTASLSEPPSVTRGAPRVHIDPHLSALHRESRSPTPRVNPRVAPHGRVRCLPFRGATRCSIVRYA